MTAAAWSRSERLGLAIGFVCLLGMLIGVILTEDQIRGDQAELGSQYEALVQSCVRLNILRAEDNLSHYADWNVFGTVLRESPHTPSRRRFLYVLGQAEREKQWTPLTNCLRAVDRRGVRFRAPRAISFSRRRPPRYDLYPPPRSAALLGG